MRFQEKLVKLCEDRGWIQADLARAVKSVSRNTVSRWWNGEIKPFDDEALKLARIFGCSLDYLADDAQDDPHSVELPPIELPDDEQFILETYRGLRDNQGMTCKEARDRLMARTAEAMQRLMTWVESGREKAKPADGPPSEAGKPGSGGVVRVRDIPRSKDGNGNSPGMNHSNDPVIPKPPDNPVPRRGRK